uniref:Uncharacterized protein n=1 Tax=Arundo donax TaxID=35708 RepID=A0A0A9HJR3_ARUDO
MRRTSSSAHPLPGPDLQRQCKRIADVKIYSHTLWKQSASLCLR